jgi:hypothetical protein
MRPAALDSAAEVDRVVGNLLRGSKALGKFPTPVDDIVAFGELAVAKNIDLGKVERGFFPKLGFLSSALKKILGVIDFKKRTIYLDKSQPRNRQTFIKLHEVGHGTLPWQRELREGYGDDEISLNPDLNEQFECEANHFASAALFQLDRFDEELLKLPLSFSSVRALAQKYGASIQSTARRYVARCPRRCALLVFHKPHAGTTFSVPIRNCFESASFLTAFGELGIPALCGDSYPFIQDIRRNRRMHETGVFTGTTSNTHSVVFNYHFFNNGYNSFVFLFPPGEKIGSKTRILERTIG